MRIGTRRNLMLSRVTKVHAARLARAAITKKLCAPTSQGRMKYARKKEKERWKNGMRHAQAYAKLLLMVAKEASSFIGCENISPEPCCEASKAKTRSFLMSQ